MFFGGSHFGVCPVIPIPRVSRDDEVRRLAFLRAVRTESLIIIAQLFCRKWGKKPINSGANKWRQLQN
jgi:hypothetical protein